MPAKAVWWLRPTWSVAVIVVPTSVAALMIPAQDYLANWRTPKYFDASALASILAAVAALIFPSLIVRTLAHRRHLGSRWTQPLEPRERRFALRAFRVLMALTLFGYAAWIYLGISRGVSLAELRGLFSGQTTSSTLKTTLTPVAGLTTFTQFGIAAAGLGTYLYLKTRNRSSLLGVAGLLILATARALFNSERLALIEIAIVVIVIVVQFRTTTRGPVAYRKAALIPLIVAPLVFAVFAGFEYTRSFNFYSTQSSQLSLLSFSAERLEGYYATSYNNSVIAEDGFWPPQGARVPYFAFGFVWDFPVLKGNTYASLAGFDPDTRWAGVLDLYGNPEFNNPGGITSPLVDLGLPLGLLFLAGAGFILALVFRQFASADPVGILLYPTSSWV